MAAAAEPGGADTAGTEYEAFLVDFMNPLERAEPLRGLQHAQTCPSSSLQGEGFAAAIPAPPPHAPQEAAGRGLAGRGGGAADAGRERRVGRRVGRLPAAAQHGGQRGQRVRRTR